MNVTNIVRYYQFLIGLSLLCLVVASSSADSSEENDECQSGSRFTFSWQFEEACNLVPRGGVSKGAPVKLTETATEGWIALQAEDLSKKEKDRLAILAMAGPYRVSFDFLEVMGYSKDYKPDQPYQSWGTEYVYVVEDNSDFISLQHIMVMFLLKEGEVMGPFVMKHWRQDWQYEKQELLVYSGGDIWKKQPVDETDRKGTWAQSVFQVDDSPRYESYGHWVHQPGFSTWRSQLTTRPLPRREFSKRDDYDLLEGVNRHTILPNGWVQEEENNKMVLDDEGLPDADLPYLAKELGVARYEAITGHDWSEGDAYWSATEDFWRAVREEWRSRVESFDTATISKTIEGRSLYEVMFSYAAEYEEGVISDDDAVGIIAEVIDYIVEEKTGG